MTAVSQLEELLQRIGYKLDLTPTQHQLAEERYKSVGKWLQEAQGVIGGRNTEIYPQGSMRLGTTVKPVKREDREGKIFYQEQKEYDLDFVYELNLRPEENSPMAVLEALEKRLRGHDGYKRMIERKKRCVRLVYSNEFHMDILPACSMSPHSNLIAIPDRERRAWLSSNPKGFASWFEGRAGQGKKEFLESIQPLPDHTYATPPLVRVVQLLKRWRDHSFNKEMAPCSILLTTLAGYLFQGEIGILDALHSFTTRLKSEIGQSSRVLRVSNPTNPSEIFSEQWEKFPASYREFCVQVQLLEEQIGQLLNNPGLEKAKGILKNLFGEGAIKNALKDSASALQKLREEGRLRVDVKTGILGAAAAQSVAIKPNNFFGNEVL